MAIRTIILKGLPERVEGVVNTAQTIRPGDHVNIDGTVAPDTYDLGGAGSNEARSIAVEDDLQGRDVNTPYTAGERIQVCQFATGMEAAVRAGGAVAKGEQVEAAANGEFIALAAGTPVATALEAGVADALMRVRFI